METKGITIQDIQTDRLRQVLKASALPNVKETRVQRLWLVQNGEPYQAEEPKDVNDVKILSSDAEVNTETPTMWCPMRVDWRDIETVVR